MGEARGIKRALYIQFAFKYPATRMCSRTRRITQPGCGRERIAEIHECHANTPRTRTTTLSDAISISGKGLTPPPPLEGKGKKGEGEGIGERGES